MTDKPGEFWIDEIVDDVDEIGMPYIAAYFEPIPGREQIHVIEYSALMNEAEAHKRMAAMYEAERARNEKLRTSLKAIRAFDGVVGEMADYALKADGGAE